MDGRCIEAIGYVGQNEPVQKVQCIVYTKHEDLFDSPCPSTTIGVYHVHTSHVKMEIMDMHMLSTQAIRITDEQPDRAISMCVLHDI